MFSNSKGMDEAPAPAPTDVKRQSVIRLYKAGSWDTLDKIVCNKCKQEKDKYEYSMYRYTCKQCVGIPVAKSKPRTEPHKHRLYKNGDWAIHDHIVCSACKEDKLKIDFKINRYICIPCSKARMRELNKKKNGGKYDDLQKEYNAHYEATPHGMKRRQEYRDKQKTERYTTATRKVNPLNRLRINIQNKICDLLAKSIPASAAIQYLGITLNIMRNWVAFNFEEDMSWENMGTVWKLELVPPPAPTLDLASEKSKYDVFNWRHWCPTHVGDAEPRDLREKSLEFLAK
jgi:hypothetical protein